MFSNTIPKFKNKISEINEDRKSETYADRFWFVCLRCIISILLALFFTLILEILPQNFSTSKMALTVTAIYGVFAIIFFLIYILSIPYLQTLTPKVVMSVMPFLFLISTSFVVFAHYQSSAMRLVSGLIFLVVALVYPFLLRNDWKKPKFWIIATITIMLLAFVIGLLFINGLTGYEPLEWYLNVEGNVFNQYGTIDCTSQNKFTTQKLFVGKNVTCLIDPPLNVTTAKVKFVSYSAEPDRDIFPDIISGDSRIIFTAPGNVSLIFFEITGVSQKNITLSLNTLGEHTFYTSEEYKERNQKFITAILVLFGAILFSVPSMMVSFRKLSKSSEEKENKETPVWDDKGYN